VPELPGTPVAGLDYGVTVAAKISEFGPLTPLPQLSWIFRGPGLLGGSKEMPMVSPGQMLRLPNWLETWIGLVSHPLLIENGHRMDPMCGPFPSDDGQAKGVPVSCRAWRCPSAPTRSMR
jgi:hypothetical protein